MKNLKNEKGAITLVVLVSMLFLLSFLMSAYMIVSNRAQKQSEISSEIQQMYSNDQDLNVLYNSYMNNEIIPIYTVEQLLKIGSDEQLLINNKYCKMTWNATYSLMEDLEIDASTSWTPINSNESFKGYFEGNGHTIKVTNSSDEIEIYSTLNNYKYYIKVGDIVEYTPASIYTASAPYTVPTQYTGCTGTFYTDIGETVEWKVLEKQGDIIKIIPNAVSTTNLKISGANGWNNCIDALNDVCGAIYGNTTSEYYTATAESIDVNDINEIAGYTPKPSTTSYNASDYEQNSANYFPIEYLKEKGITNPMEITEGCGYSANSDITIESTNYDYSPENQTKFNIKFAKWINLGKTYWLASRCVFPNSSNAEFRVRYEFSSGAMSAHIVYRSVISNASPTCAVRPVVSLTPKVPLQHDKTVDNINYWTFSTT